MLGIVDSALDAPLSNHAQVCVHAVEQRAQRPRFAPPRSGPFGTMAPGGLPEPVAVRVEVLQAQA
ncbi:hypothetical protein AMK30_02010 [Streptomyces sp. CB02460]|nr:hypothetical protein AMK30_02010 [Streptomyces sp. CB02460]